MDKAAQVVLVFLLGMAAVIAAQGWAEGRACVVSKSSIDSSLSSDIDYSKYDW